MCVCITHTFKVTVWECTLCLLTVYISQVYIFIYIFSPMLTMNMQEFRINLKQEIAVITHILAVDFVKILCETAVTL
jgi:hypothetical protein